MSQLGGLSARVDQPWVRLGEGLPPLPRWTCWQASASRRADCDRSAAAAAGVPAKVISERLGHATIAVTMDIYGHVLPGPNQEAADSVTRRILGGSAVPEASLSKPLASGRGGQDDQDG